MDGFCICFMGTLFRAFDPDGNQQGKQGVQRHLLGTAAQVPHLQHSDIAWDADICARDHFDSHRLSLSSRGHS